MQTKSGWGQVKTAYNPTIAVGTSLLVIAMVFADAPVSAQPQEDFTFRRVKPPVAGQKKRITIQVERTWPYRDEADNTDVPEIEQAETEPAARSDDWFWSEISPQLDAADPIRLDRALTALNKNAAKRDQIAPSVEMMNDIVARHGADILLATAGKRVSPAFVLAVIAVESGGRPDAKSNKGATGLMQLMPATAARFDVEDPSDPKQNIQGGVAYLDWLFAKFGGDPILSLAGYNAGENAVLENNGVPPYPETRAYVPKVVAAWDHARRYCQTLPKFADDGCVFELSRSFSN